MPETAVHEDDFPPRGKNQIRRSWQLLAIQTETISKTVNKRTDEQFRFGVP
jgi:hypothetical protein